jgi:hypothetical protein
MDIDCIQPMGDSAISDTKPLNPLKSLFLEEKRIKVNASKKNPSQQVVVPPLQWRKAKSSSIILQCAIPPSTLRVPDIVESPFKSVRNIRRVSSIGADGNEDFSGPPSPDISMVKLFSAFSSPRTDVYRTKSNFSKQAKALNTEPIHIRNSQHRYSAGSVVDSEKSTNVGKTDFSTKESKGSQKRSEEDYGTAESRGDKSPNSATNLKMQPKPRNWTTLSHVFRSMVLFKNEEVKNIDNIQDILDEMDNYNLRNGQDEENLLEKHDYAKEAFQMIRRIELFCDCAAIGAKKHVQVMDQLLENDPKKYVLDKQDPDHLLNRKNAHGHTAMYLAAKNGNLLVVSMLVERGANHLQYSLVNGGAMHERPLQGTVRWGHIPVVRYLLEHCVYDKEDILDSLKMAENKEIKALLNHYLENKLGIKMRS